MVVYLISNITVIADRNSIVLSAWVFKHKDQRWTTYPPSPPELSRSKAK